MGQQRFDGQNALMVVQSLSRENRPSDDYCRFVAPFGRKGKLGSLTFTRNTDGANLYLGWVISTGLCLNLHVL
ncbi:MAG: DUF6946 family protein [Dehalococcoidia bacterium]